MSYIVIDGDTCEAVCPTGAVTIKDETDKAREIFQSDKETTRVVVEVAPAVRVALGEKSLRGSKRWVRISWRTERSPRISSSRGKRTS